MVQNSNGKTDERKPCAAGKAGGILPGYHMNKNHWITILLDGTVKKERIFLCLR